MTARTINVRLPEALYNQIEELAKATARKKKLLGHRCADPLCAK
jgi:predicted DNA-binding protein